MENNSESKACAICKNVFTPTTPLFILCVNCRGKMSTMTIESLPEEQRTTIVKGDKPVIEKTIHNLATRVCELSLRSRMLGIELGRVKKDLEEAMSYASIKSPVNSNDDISECSNSLSDFENESDDDSDDDLDDDSQVVRKVYNINLNFC